MHLSIILDLIGPFTIGINTLLIPIVNMNNRNLVFQLSSIVKL